ncbi:calcium-binding protein [Pararhizobium polonicum]|uniref:calcium-binding protein n=1 Tax=Pararhizobium polonicum TaxID=1612624 RepID=UPI000839E5C9|nr:calcium-binding protein [Pararhizobium polonicum]
MASKIFNVDSVGAAAQASLLGNEFVFVGVGVSVGATADSAIYGTGNFLTATIKGSVIGASSGIYFDGAANSWSKVLVEKTGYVAGFYAGITMNTYGGTIDNRGSIWGNDFGIRLNAQTAVNNTYQTKIINSGTIEADTAIEHRGTDQLYLVNTGKIIGNGTAFMSYDSSIDRIVNTGTMVGYISLGAGNDSYDGSLGILDGATGVGTGFVSGGDGEDDILGGKRAENLSGGNGDDDIDGGAGNDQIYGDAGNDQLIGGSGNDYIYGGADNDILDGGSGIDYLSGGTGGDLYLVDNIADRVIEAVGEGQDFVFTSVSYTLEYGQEIEALVYYPISTTVKSVTLTGNAFAQSITGGSGNDTLDGGGGSDTLTGGSGNDTYIIDGGDRIIEDGLGGTDLVKSSVSYTLAANVENLTLTGSGNISGKGNGLANTIVGNSGKNTLSGGAGKDTLSGGSGDDSLNGGLAADKLTGGAGKDVFLFDTALGGGNIDTITDFSVIDDTIHLQNSVFTALTKAGALSSAAFASNTTGLAGDASDRIIYEKDTGKLFYDADGTGSAGGVQFALLAKDLALTAADFIIV